jgi:hypothetical protein
MSDFDLDQVSSIDHFPDITYFIIYTITRL